MVSLDKIEARERAKHPANAAAEIAQAAWDLAASGKMDPNAAALIFRLGCVVSELAIQTETADQRRHRLWSVSR